MSKITSLFGQSDSKQHSLFGEGEDRLQVPAPDYKPSPDKVRARLTLILNTAREAEQMPWAETEARMWETVFPNMAKWLPEDEARQLCFDFEREVARLKAA